MFLKQVTSEGMLGDKISVSEKLTSFASPINKIMIIIMALRRKRHCKLKKLDHFCLQTNEQFGLFKKCYHKIV